MSEKGVDTEVDYTSDDFTGKEEYIADADSQEATEEIGGETTPTFEPTKDRKIISMISSIIVVAFFLVSIGAMIIYIAIPKLMGGIPDGMVLTDMGDYYEVTNYDGFATEIVIPAKYEGKPIRSIGDSAFNSCVHLKEIVIPDSVEHIGNSAFFICTSLENVTLGNNIISIGSYAFAGCERLVTMTIPASVTSIGIEAFRACRMLESIIVDGDNGTYKSIDGNLYSNDGKTFIKYAEGKSGEVVIISSEVSRINGYAFAECDGITSVIIPDSVTIVEDFAFSDCDNLTIYCEAVSQPDDWYLVWNSDARPVVWGHICFDEAKGGNCDVCGGPTANNLADPATNFEYKIIDGEVTITKYIARNTLVAIPSEIEDKPVTEIGTYAFNNCHEPIRIILPDSLTSIGLYAFSNCTRLASINIPNGVTSIGSHAFRECTSLASITLPSTLRTIEGSAFYNCDSLTNITLPSTLRTIGGSAFYNCASLTNITIPNSVTSIGSEAFTWCANLTIYCEAYDNPDGWVSSWNADNRPVVWGYKGE